MRSNGVPGRPVRASVLGAAVIVLTSVGPALAQSAGPVKPAQTAPPVGGTASGGQDSQEALARQLSNPVASLVSVPFQLNWNEGLGPDDEGRQFLRNFQPVLPFRLNKDWNLIARVITPILGGPSWGFRLSLTLLFPTGS